LFGLLGATIELASCASGTASVPPASPDAPEPAKIPVAATSATAPPGTSLANDSAPSQPKHPPASASDCKDLASESSGAASAGAPMSNATLVPGAAPSDRFLPLTELIKSKRPAFRCCFDVWAKKSASAAGDVRMVVKLAPDGSVKDVSFADTANRLQAPPVEACISDIAKSLKYPKSPAGKETTFTFPFNFKPGN
jgi:hypothetical protein